MLTAARDQIAGDSDFSATKREADDVSLPVFAVDSTVCEDDVRPGPASASFDADKDIFVGREQAGLIWRAVGGLDQLESR